MTNHYQTRGFRRLGLDEDVVEDWRWLKVNVKLKVFFEHIRRVFFLEIALNMAVHYCPIGGIIGGDYCSLLLLN